VKSKKGLIAASIAAIAVAGFMIWRTTFQSAAPIDDAIVKRNAELTKDDASAPATPGEYVPSGPRLVKKK